MDSHMSHVAPTDNNDAATYVVSPSPPSQYHLDLAPPKRDKIRRHITQKLMDTSMPIASCEISARTIEQQAYASAATLEAYLAIAAKHLTQLEQTYQSLEMSSMMAESPSTVTIPSTTNSAAAAAVVNWRTSFSDDERDRVRAHMISKISVFYKSAPEQSIHDRVVCFEQHALDQSASVDEYLREVTRCLELVEQRVTQNSTSNHADHNRTASF